MISFISVFKPRVLLVIVVLLVSLVAVFTYDRSHLRIVGNDPNIDNMTIWTPYLKINLNKPVSSASLSISASPDILYGRPISRGKTVIIYLSVPLDPSKTYTIMVRRIASASGQQVINKQYSFRPKVVSQGQIPDDQREALILRNQQSPVYKDPLLTHLPFRSVDFSLTSSFGSTDNNQPVLTLKAQLVLHRAQLGNSDAAIAADKQQVRDYISSFGLNPDNYTLQYSVISP
jgi:hypothetical protein